MFGGNRVIWISAAGDGLAKSIEPVLASETDGNLILIDAEALTKASRLRKLFETHPRAASAALYEESPQELRLRLERLIKSHGLAIDEDACHEDAKTRSGRAFSSVASWLHGLFLEIHTISLDAIRRAVPLSPVVGRVGVGRRRFADVFLPLLDCCRACFPGRAIAVVESRSVCGRGVGTDASLALSMTTTGLLTAVFTRHGTRMTRIGRICAELVREDQPNPRYPRSISTS